MKALVTGAGGFIGGALVRLLLERGDEVRALVREVGALAGTGAEVVRGDATDPAPLARAIAGRDVVFHLAGVRRATAREEFMRVNAGSTRAALEACLAVAPRLRRFVLAGSLAAAGPSREGKREEDGFDPREPYGESKAEAERIALSYADRLPVAVARPPRVIGPGDRENLFFFKIVRAGLVVRIVGPPRPLSFIDVEDCARGFVALAEHPRAAGESFFLASPERTDLEGLQREVARALGVTPRSVSVPPWALLSTARALEVAGRLSGRRFPLNRKLATQILAPGWTCDTRKARERLGFEARIKLAESVRRAARWYQAHGWL